MDKMERTELQALLGGKPAASAVRAPTPEPADVDGAFLIDTALPSPSRFRSALAALGPTPAPVPVSGSTIDPLPPAAPRAPAPRYAPADSLWSAPRPLAPAVPPAPAASLPPPPVEAAPPTPPPPPAETPRPRISTASSPESRARAVRAKMYRLLDQATPRLQRYALEHCEGEPSREQRQKLRDLLQWVFEKEGYRIMPGAPTPYRIGSRAIQGRIDLMVQAIDGRYLLALETDWTKKSASVYKLSHWAAQKVPVAWVVGADCTRTQLKTWRHFADEVLGGRTQDWLPILHVEHGWLPES